MGRALTKILAFRLAREQHIGHALGKTQGSHQLMLSLPVQNAPRIPTYTIYFNIFGDHVRLYNVDPPSALRFLESPSLLARSRAR